MSEIRKDRRIILSKFSSNDNLVLSIFFINVIAFSSIPLTKTIFARSTLLVILIFCFLALINLGNKTLSKPVIKFNIFSFLGFIIIGCFMISSFYFNLEASLNVKTISKLSIYPIIIFLFFYIFSYSLYSNDFKFEKFLNLYLYFAIINSIIAFLFMYMGYYPGLIFEGHTLGFFYHTNTFSFVFTIAIPIALYKYFSKQLPITLFAILMFILSSCLLFTYSRAGYIGVLVGISILLYKKSKMLFVTCMLLILLLGSSLIWGFATAKDGSSMFTRFQVLYVAYDMMFNYGTAKLLWGYGVIKNVEVFQGILTYTFGDSRTEMGPHNFIFTLGIQFGIILAVTSVIFITLLLVKAFFIKMKQVGLDSYQRINLSISIVMGLLIQCLFEDLIVYPEFFAMPIILIFSGYLYYYVNKIKVLK